MKASLGALAVSFLRLSTTNYGGAQSAAIRREFVRRRGWITEEEYLEFRSIATIAPGPNSPNLAILIGQRLCGTPGAAIAFFAASVPGVVILLILGGFALDPRLGTLRAALRGCAASAVGLTLANALELTYLFRADRTRLAFVAAAALAVAVFHLPLWTTLALFVPLAIAFVRPLGAGRRS